MTKCIKCGKELPKRYTRNYLPRMFFGVIINLIKKKIN